MTRTNRTYTLWVEYANVGDADLPAPLLVVSTSPALQIRTQHRVGWVNGTIHLLGVNPSEPAGSCHPAHGRIALLVQTPLEARNMTTSLQVLEAAPGAIDWNVYQSTLRPDAMAQAEWDVLWPVLHARLGDTWLGYVTALGDDATRLRPRGVDVYDVRQLLAFEMIRAAGEPIAATTGRVFDAQTQIPVAATRVIARRQDGLSVRADQSGQWGGFSIAYLPDGVYDLVVEGYIITPTVTVTVTQATDANGVRLYATPIPPDQEPDPPLVQYAGPQVLDVEGTPHLVFSVDGQIYHTTYTSTTWTAATPISGAWGTAPRLIYAPTLLDGTDPGLALFWRAGEGNEAAIEYAAARQDGLGGWEWSEPAVYADSTGAGNTNPAAVVDADGTPVVVWQMMDFGDPAADTDLYYGHEPMTSTVLSWDQIAGLLVLDREAHLDNATVLPPGAVVALTRSGEAMVIASSAQEWEQEVSLNFEFEKKGMVPRYVPYIGGKNIVKFSAALAGTANEEEAEVSGSLGGEVSIMQERVTGSVEGQVSAHWALDKRECVFNLDKGTLTTSLGLTGKFPIPQLTWEDEIFHIVKTEVGVQVGGTLTGELVWTAQGGAWPDGKVTGLISLGFYGEVEFMGAVEGAVTGLGNLEATINATGFEVSDIYFQAQASAQAGALKYELTWRYPPEEEGMALSYGATLEEAVYAALEDGMQVSTTVSLAAKPGTTTVYSASAVLPNVGTDLVDDGAPELVQGGDGLTYLFWHRESGDLGTTLGNTLTYATYDGAAWSAPHAPTGTLGFGREPAAAPDDSGNLLVAWVHADATGWTLASDPNALVDAYDNAQVRFAVMQPGGAWSMPAPITTTLGAYRDVSLTAQPGGGVVATWLRTDTAAPALYAAFWNGSSMVDPSNGDRR